MNRLRFLVLGLLVCGLAATASAAPIVDNNEIYIWGDPYGDQFDNYAEVSPGDTIALQIWVNDLNGSYDMLYENTLVNENWTHAANGARTGVWWDPAFIDGPSVHEDKHVGEDPTTYYGSYWGSTGNNSHLAHYWTKHYDNWNAVRWVAESRWVIDMVFTIREDAPSGLTHIGLEQGFFWSNNMFDQYGGYFFWDRIETDDPYGMTLFVTGGLPGDFDSDGDVDTDDIDELCDNLGDAAFDLDGDGDADEDDLIYLVENLAELTDGSGRTGTKLADFNLDGLINATDLATMNANFGTSSGLGYADGNANCDDLINATDLAILDAHFGYIAPSAAVPEPVTLGLLSIGWAAVLSRPRGLRKRSQNT